MFCVEINVHTQHEIKLCTVTLNLICLSKLAFYNIKRKSILLVQYY